MVQYKASSTFGELRGSEASLREMVPIVPELYQIQLSNSSAMKKHPGLFLLDISNINILLTPSYCFLQKSLTSHYYCYLFCYLFSAEGFCGFIDGKQEMVGNFFFLDLMLYLLVMNLNFLKKLRF